MSVFEDILNEPDETESVVESTSPTDTEPAAEAVAEVETPTPEATAEPTTVEPTATLPEGYKLDALGRVHGPDGRVVSKDEAERIKAQAAPVVTPEPIAPVIPEVAPVTPAPEPVTPQPFAVRVNGKRHEFAGLVVPPEQQERIRALLVNGMNHEQNFPRMQAEWKQRLQAAEQMVEAKSGKYNKASVYLFDKVAQLLADHPQELEMTRRELALMLKEADLSIPKAPAPQEPQVNEQQMEQAARSTLVGYLGELFEDTPDAVKYFTAEDRKDIEDAFQSRLNAYYVEHEGQIVLDTFAAKKDFERELRIQQRSHQARETATRDAQKAKQAAAFNKAQQPTTAAPTPTTRKPTPAVAAAPSGKPKGWDQSFKSAWSDEDDE